ncbi:MAG TPA: YceI family protein [Casimicrobiaceae bacterium]|nr:YceI family protein [Casimicrobiaceae bacterium]
MIRAYLFPALAVAVPLTALAGEETYVFDPVHSQPICEVRHMGFSLQHVSFGKISGKVTLDREAHRGSLDATVDTNSVRSYSEKLDAHLKGEDFFNVAKYPTMTFKSSDLVFEGDKVVAANGELTLLGVTRPVSFKVANFVCGEQPFNKRAMCGAEATAIIMRSEWGMKYGIPKAAADEVKIVLPVEAFRE